MNIEGHFDFIIASAVVGFAKPDVRIFKEALVRSGAVPTEALHVGDSIENDVFGARRSGIDALLLCRHAQTADNIDCIHSLTEIAQ